MKNLEKIKLILTCKRISQKVILKTARDTKDILKLELDYIKANPQKQPFPKLLIMTHVRKPLTDCTGKHTTGAKVYNHP